MKLFRLVAFLVLSFVLLFACSCSKKRDKRFSSGNSNNNVRFTKPELVAQAYFESIIDNDIENETDKVTIHYEKK